MKTSIDLDQALVVELERTASLIKERPATVLRMAIRAGLPLVAGRFQSTRPEGYFAEDYPLPKDRRALESALSKSINSPDR